MCGVQAADVCTAVLSSADGRTAERLGQDVRRLLEASKGNLFDAKTDAASSSMYFHYYGMLQHQQNMLQVRPAGAHACGTHACVCEHGPAAVQQ